GDQPVGQQNPQLRRRNIVLNRTAIGVQAQQGECPGARGAKLFDARERLAKQAGGPFTPGRAAVLLRAFAQSPQCASMAVLRTALFQPDTPETHEIPEAPRRRVPGVLKEG